jgi:maleamate amidohydrolase
LPRPFWEAIKEFPTSCRQVARSAARNIERLAVLRARGWPVLYPYVAPKEKFDVGRLAEKTPSSMAIPEK